MIEEGLKIYRNSRDLKIELEEGLRRKVIISIMNL